MNNAIIYLLNNSRKDILFFRESIVLLEKNYLNQFACDVICFYEPNFPKEEIEYINSLIKFKITYKQIEFKLPEYSQEILDKIPEYVPHPEIPNALGFSMGYRYMCNFFAGEVFKEKCLQKYKYVWRLDTDSFILNFIKYNVFNRMAHSKAKYGYINIQFDHPQMTLGLWNLSNKYFIENNKSPIIDINLPEHKNRVFYTNFEIFDMEWFRGKEYEGYYNYINESGGIFIYRWGDHCIRYIGVKSLIPENEILFFDDIHYFHSREFFNEKIINFHS